MVHGTLCVFDSLQAKGNYEVHRAFRSVAVKKLLKWPTEWHIAHNTHKYVLYLWLLLKNSRKLMIVH